MAKNTRQTANRLLTKYLDSVSKERTELIDHPDLGAQMVSKAEAMARLMFNMALGYTETVETDLIVGGKKAGVTETKVNHKPDKGMISLIYDRLEGRATTSEDAAKKKSTIADKVSGEGVKRIKQAGKHKNK